MPVWNIHDEPDGPPPDDFLPNLPASLTTWQPNLASPSIYDHVENLGGPAVENPPWILGPCLQPGDCAYIVGEAGTGKSTLVADLLTAVCDTARSDALAGAWRVARDLLPPTPRALVINAETSPANAWRVHLMRANAAAGHSPGSEADLDIRSRVDFLDKDHLGITPANLSSRMAELANFCASRAYSVVVVDPIYALFAPDEPGADAWVTQGLKALLTALKAHGILTLAITHPPESNTRSIKTSLKPYGSSQQKAQTDAHFGLRRTKEGNAVELIKLKDRRAGWIPPLRARTRLTFNPVGGGYSAYKHSGSDWPYDNPNEFVLSDSARDYLRQLPTEPFLARDVEARGLRRATFLAHVECFYAPQGLVTVTTADLPRKPNLYTWTPRGLRAKGA